MGKEKQNREAVSFRFPAEELRKWREAATEAKETITDWIRRSCRLRLEAGTVEERLTAIEHELVRQKFARLVIESRDDLVELAKTIRVIPDLTPIFDERCKRPKDTAKMISWAVPRHDRYPQFILTTKFEIIDSSACPRDKWPNTAF